MSKGRQCRGSEGCDDGKAQELRRQAKGTGNATTHHLKTTDLSFLE